MKKHLTFSTSKSSLWLFLLLISAFSWSQTINVEGPYMVPNGISYHKQDLTSNSAVVNSSPEIAARINTRSNACATINVNYGGSVPSGAITAFEFAADIWAAALESSIPITINVEFIDLPSDVIASAEPNGYFTLSGIGLPDTLYPKALAEALSGAEIGGSGSLDLTVSFNDESPFYYGTDASPSGSEYDFVTIALHNMGHGLGFIGFGIVDATDGYIRDPLPSIYDTFVENGSGASILSFTDPSPDLLTQLTSDDLFVNGTNANSANSGSRPKIYAPNPFSFFESYDHWDSAVFPPSNPNSLMAESIALGQVNHNPGDVTLGFLADMGWVLCQTLSNENFDFAAFKLLENPVTNQLTLLLNSAQSSSEAKVIIFDMSGKTVFQEERSITDGKLSLSNMENLNSGIYFLNVDLSNGEQIQNLKFIKN